MLKTYLCIMENGKVICIIIAAVVVLAIGWGYMIKEYLENKMDGK